MEIKVYVLINLALCDTAITSAESTMRLSSDLLFLPFHGHSDLEAWYHFQVLNPPVTSASRRFEFEWSWETSCRVRFILISHESRRIGHGYHCLGSLLHATWPLDPFLGLTSMLPQLWIAPHAAAGLAVQTKCTQLPPNLTIFTWTHSNRSSSYHPRGEGFDLWETIRASANTRTGFIAEAFPDPHLQF